MLQTCDFIAMYRNSQEENGETVCVWQKLPCESCSHSIPPSFPPPHSLTLSLSSSRRADQWQPITSKSSSAEFKEGVFAWAPLCSLTSTIKFFHILTLTASMEKQNITPALQPHKLLPKAVSIKFPHILLYKCVLEQEGKVNRHQKLKTLHIWTPV